MTQEQSLGELQKQLVEAIQNREDISVIGKLSKEISRLVAAEEKAENESKVAASKALKDKIEAAINKVVEKHQEELGELDGVWYSNDFAAGTVATKLLKSSERKSGGGGGKKFGIGTPELLSIYGDEDSGDGTSFKDSFESNKDGNHRYQIRVKLLKKHGLI